ncbi:MAG: N-methyl-L-tryptophan oxidase [Planctomycetaceae bacterium]|nr:N-methyl-L-tryptophan oxidase [Planctomycetaceae bacterium]
MGASALYHLARRGADVVGIEQFELGHPQGSSHGRTRVFRTTYDDQLYVELARESLELWRRLEEDSNTKLLELCGLLIFASRDNERFSRTLEELASAGLPHDVMDGLEASQRFPTFKLTDSHQAFFASQNGFLYAERALELLRERAIDQGAGIIDRCRVLSIEPQANGLRVKTTEGAIDADRVVVTAGAWLDRVAPDLDWTLDVTREQKVYFEVTDPDRVSPEIYPCFCEYDTAHYGFPSDDGRTIKVAADHVGASVDPDDVDREVGADYIQQMRDWIQQWQPGLAATAGQASVCLYTNTPDNDFLIGTHPQNQRLVLAGGFSGHGFKFSILVGDILADLVLDGHTSRSIDRFRVDRFLSAGH